MEFSLFYVTLCCIVLKDVVGQSQRQRHCEQGSCYPATGDLLIGRGKQLRATSTCGMVKPDRYCVVSYLEKRTKCFQCDSREPWQSRVHENSHRIENIVSSFKDRRDRWWQAENGVENVSIQLDLEAEFHFTHLIMTFKTFRPKSMFIERSYDFGKTWKVYRYFAQSCRKSFPGIPRGPVRSMTDVICQTKYSAETPSTQGEVIFRVLPPFIPIKDPYSEQVQDLLKLTNLRVNFTELHTLGDTQLDSRPEIKDKYYYSLFDMTVRGSCSCYGHASRCLPVPGYDTYPNMVHGMCECTHNTKGLNCEMCEEFYNDLPWQPARKNQPNACKKCNCNNHAAKCHFDPAVFEATGEVSGGICDNCQHNTQGRNCQECKPFFFQDPNRDIRDPEICQPCDCDPAGSERNGECESHTDEVLGLEGGRCRCKRHVRGSRCDQCVENYWNLQGDNPLGCDACSCNPLGTLGDYGCDQHTGLCLCKRYVTGQNCDTCHRGFYGLSDGPYGCEACNCDIGGSLSESCDQQSGQCTCRPHIMGKHCKQVEPGYFFAGLDYYIYEAEFGRGTGNARVYIREPIPGGPSYWTGPGYMRVMEGDSIEFTVTDISFPTYYDIVLRYDPRMPEMWEDVRVTVVRPDQVDPDGLCADFNPQEDIKSVTIEPGARYQLVTPPSCLESGKMYTIRLDFQRYKQGQLTPDATMFIDSLILVPHTDAIPIYQIPGLHEYMKNDFLRNRCRQLQFNSIQADMPDVCKGHIFSISAVLHNGAIDCDCDPTGSVSRECNPEGGRCPCKPNVVGRRCDQCAPGTYGFGPNGCTACNCHNIGARDNFCNEQTGQCTCIQNAYGRACDSCRVGFWGFPQCRQCQCNGNADTCDNLDGRCIACKNFTDGQYCDRCMNGYYGDPRVGVRIPCRPCLCPGGPGSENQHADTCTLDPRSSSVTCDCYPGYERPTCDRCSENYFGNPLSPGGSCEQCMCNNNIDPDVAGSCDRESGECLKCLFNTEGFSCEHCTPGYYGDATTQDCKSCVCFSLGTDADGGQCDRRNGQCPCLPNVMGLRCDQCAPGHYNLQSGKGCDACNCDPQGSLSTECTQLEGQCECRAGRGGQTCGDCEDFFWGDPLDQCFPCDCDPQGSTSMQCDRRTGQCVCEQGVTGYKCDRCARGTTGDLPNCVPCGECFDNWDRIIRDLRDQTHSLVETGNNISVTGAIKAFDDEFKHMQNNIDEIRRILSTANVTRVDVQDIQNMLDTIRRNLTESNKALNNVDRELSNTTARVQSGNNQIAILQRRVEDLKNLAEELRGNATDIQARDVEGAFNITREAERRSREAQRKVDETQRTVVDSKRTRQQVDALIDQRRDDFNNRLKENKASLDELDGKVSTLGGRLSNLNEQVCGSQAAPCDTLCGGGGCGRCGGASCGAGAVTKANKALRYAQQAADILDSKQTEAYSKVTNLESAKQDAEQAKADAKMAYDQALLAKNQSESAREDLEDLLHRVRQFFLEEAATPESIEKVAQEVLAMSISLTPAQIEELADKINRTIQGLQNIDSILDDTRDDLAKAKRLKQRADDASGDASAIQKTAEDVLSALDGAKKAQEEAEREIITADKNIQDANQDLAMIESETTSAADTSNRSMTILDRLKARLSDLRKKYNQNKFEVEEAEKASREATDLANQAERDANDLDNKYQSAAGRLNNKFNMTSDANERATRLKKRADELAAGTQEKYQNLKRMQQDFEDNNKTLNELSDMIDELNRRMQEYLDKIQEKSKYYRNC
ncbi:laminin subunit beta-1-like [Haliotis cracherodii]|uniref:laminin subunit beta-1-like n=1 Tax=Haliotis cracherodii TaxID=6455 RepID=UPI0039ED0215